MIEISQGNDHKLTYNFKDPTNTPKNLNGTIALRFALSKRKGGTPDLLLDLEDAEITITDPINGAIEVDLKKEVINLLESRIYFLEIWQTNALSQSTTLHESKIHVKSKIIKE